MPDQKSEFIKLFISAILETMKVQCERTFCAGKPLKPEQFLNEHKIEISGSIGITSKVFSGTISVAFPKDTFLHLMEGMLDEKYEEIDKDLIDGCGELLNISFGFAKKFLNNKGYEIAKAIPTIIHGHNISISLVSDQSVVAVPFGADNYQFLVIIGIDNAR